MAWREAAPPAHLLKGKRNEQNQNAGFSALDSTMTKDEWDGWEFTVSRWLTEPILHTGITDSIDEGDPRSWTSIQCVACETTVHAVPNECMSPWADTESGAMCLDCLWPLIDLSDYAERETK